ncbi:glycosyltransferase [Parafrankia sp. FMc2]|uniref:glycosyltransferase n=1 Tax=Parafrankia sp. FMc2 TaxID=3233196 RepID=UPI0034D4A22A
MSRALPDPREPPAAEPTRRPVRSGAARGAAPGGTGPTPPADAPAPPGTVRRGSASRRLRVDLLLLGWCGTAVGISLSDGRYSPLALAAVLFGAAAVTVALGWPAERRGRWARPAAAASGRVAVALCAVVVAVGPVVRHPRYYATGPAALAADVLAALAGALAAAALLGSFLRRARPGGTDRRGRWLGGSWWAGDGVFRGVLGLAIAAGVATVIAAPRPRIDVFHLLQVSTSGLARGENMYRQQWGPDRATYTAGGLFDVYPYLPGTSLLLAPFRWVFGDVRYGLLLALVLAAVAARAVVAGRPAGEARGGAAPGGAAPGAGEPGGGEPAGDGGPAAAPPWALTVAPVLPLLVTVFPESMYALQQSWTEPLLVLLLTGTVWAVTTGRTRLAVVAFALALASKQHVALVLPLAACWPAFGPRRALWAAGLGLVAVLPWVVASPRDFFDDAVRTNLDYQVLDHSLSVPGWAHHFGITLGFGVTAVVLALSYLLAWRARGGAAGFCAGSALVLLALDLMNKQTFFNHYTLPMALLVLAVCAAAGDQRSVENRSRDAPS